MFTLKKIKKKFKNVGGFFRKESFCYNFLKSLHNLMLVQVWCTAIKIVHTKLAMKKKAFLQKNWSHVLISFSSRYFFFTFGNQISLLEI